jgi:hypothetical protein
MLINRYEPHIISEMVSLSQPIHYAYDLGANWGFLSLAMSKRLKPGGKSFAFEPYSK